MRKYIIIGRRNKQLLECTVTVQFKGTAHVEMIPSSSMLIPQSLALNPLFMLYSLPRQSALPIIFSIPSAVVFQ